MGYRFGGGVIFVGGGGVSSLLHVSTSNTLMCVYATMHQIYIKFDLSNYGYSPLFLSYALLSISSASLLARYLSRVSSSELNFIP